MRAQREIQACVLASLPDGAVRDELRPLREANPYDANGWKAGDFFGFGHEVLVSCLDFEHAKPFLKADMTADGWHPLLGREKVLTEMKRYLDFAWGKAEDHRGLSAGRSVVKLTTFAWVLGMDSLIKEIDAAPYAYYGCPKLRVVAMALGEPLPTAPSLQRMMNGEPCSPACEGCGA